MSVFVNPFVSNRHRWLVEFAIWLAITLVLLAAGARFWSAQLDDALRSEARAKLAHFDTLHLNVAAAFSELQRTATASPCSDAFIRQLRRVAFKPDGLNEFMYAPHRMVTCSTSIKPSNSGLALGPPDIEAAGNGGSALWINKRLDSVGLSGVSGNVVFQDPFALVIPPQSSWADQSSWIRKEFVISSADGRVWHLGGEDGIFRAASAPGAPETPLSIRYGIACGATHPYCVAVRADLAVIAIKWRTELVIAACLIAFYAIWPATILIRSLERYWSLESRFRRNLNSGSIVCAYQPILDLRSGAISGCEVLARWRDVDGSIVYPDKFIDIVARSGQTLAFTRMLAERAFDELANNLPGEARLQVNFNIFPRDLDSAKLSEAFKAFDAERGRFQLGFEIVESDALGIESAQREIETLARLGIRTYIDDFGSGYSSIHRVASLAIHGVKLDRSFAMAPSGSLMARMLVPALDMMGSTGRDIVVEGVESQDRLDLLLTIPHVTCAQGYHISRPLSINDLAVFLANRDSAPMTESDAHMAAA